MTTKKWLILAALLLVLTGGAFAYSKGGDLQGKFSTKDLVTTKTATPSSSASSGTSSVKTGTYAYWLTATNHGGKVHDRTITLSSIDFDWVSSYEDEVDPADFALANVDLSFGDGVKSCGFWSIRITEAGSETEINNTLFSDVWLEFRDSASSSWIKKVDYVNPDLSHFDIGIYDKLNLSGSTYSFYVNGKVKEGLKSTVTGKTYNVYLINVCAAKDSKERDWFQASDEDRAKYFSLGSVDEKLGFLIGTFKFKQ